MKKILTSILKPKKEEKQEKNTTPSLPLPEKYRNNLVSFLGFYSEEAAIVCEKLYPFLSSFPASMKHHDNERNGLWHHSWDVAINMALRLTAQAKPTREIFIGFLVGLLHDVGKAALYEIEHDFKYNSFSLQPLPREAKIISTKNNQKNHAMLSCVFIPLFLKDILEIFSSDEMYQICEAVMNHHEKIVIDNTYLSLLKEVDVDAVKAFEERITEPIEQPQPIQLQPEQSPPIEEKKIDLNIWFDCLRNKIYTEYKTGYHFYILSYEGKNLLLVTYPKVFNEINDLYREKTQQQYHNDFIEKALLKQKYITYISNDDTVYVNVRMFINSSNLQRNLKFIVLDGDKILSREDIEKYFSNDITIKKINGKMI